MMLCVVRGFSPFDRLMPSNEYWYVTYCDIVVCNAQPCRVLLDFYYFLKIMADNPN